MTDELLHRLVAKAFQPDELAFLMENPVFKKMLHESHGTDRFDRITGLGIMLLHERDFPHSAKSQKAGVK